LAHSPNPSNASIPTAPATIGAAAELLLPLLTLSVPVGTLPGEMGVVGFWDVGLVALGFNTLTHILAVIQGEGRDKYPSITCTTPPATSTFGVTTLALFTKTLPLLSILIFTLPPARVPSVVLDSKLLYPTVPLITWYSKTLANCSVLRLLTVVSIAWNAALDGAKTVTSCRESTALTRLTAVKALARDVRFKEPAVLEMGMGAVRTRSIM